MRVDKREIVGKSKGGAICVYVSDNWCSKYLVRDSECHTDVEVLCLSLRPVYPPRDYGNIIICVVSLPLMTCKRQIN